MKKQKILVTGISGQIGRFLSRELVLRKKNFLGLDFRTSENLEFEILKIPLTEKNILLKNKKKFKDIDTLIHLASKIDVEPNILKSGKNSIEQNIFGILNLLEILPNLEHISYTSTYMVYGTPQKKIIKENHPTNPNNVYGASKLATEKFLQIFSEQNDVKLSILRLMGVYDLENPYNQAIPSFIKLIANNKRPVIYGDGNTKRNHIHITDVIDAILQSVKIKKHGIFNIGGPNSPSNLELVEIINQKFDKKIAPIFKKTREKQYDFITDISPAKKELDFYPKIGINQGIERTVKRFQNFGW